MLISFDVCGNVSQGTVITGFIYHLYEYGGTMKKMDKDMKKKHEQMMKGKKGKGGKGC